MGEVTGAECDACRWVVSGRFSYCPWCGSDIYDEDVSSEVPLRAPRGFRLDAPCTRRCGGRVQFPMEYCPWCGGEQEWKYHDRFEGNCPHCGAGVDDAMDWCPWCGEDATGQDLIQRALTRVRRLLLVSGIRRWPYRVLLRPGISGVDPDYPNTIEIEQRYVVSARKRDEIPWKLLVGLIVHELGHSFLFNNWRWTRNRDFVRLFGRVDKAYRGVDNSWVSFQRRRVATYTPDYVSGYAATHPLEDFAETFRLYVTRRARMRELLAELGRKRKGVVVYEKFLHLHHFVRSLRARG
ncbi:MAG: putative zinc-binding metallopeptidase [Gemmatimonadota bacterium]